MPGAVNVSFSVLFTVLALSFAPLLFSFLGAIPYLGVPLLILLSIWHLLAMVVGVAAVTGLSLGEAFGYVAVGWIILQVLQQTLGQPIAHLGHWLANQAAGVDLTTNRRALAEMVASRAAAASSAWSEAFQQRIAEVRPSGVSSTLDESATGSSAVGSSATVAATLASARCRRIFGHPRTDSAR